MGAFTVASSTLSLYSRGETDAGTGSMSAKKSPSDILLVEGTVTFNTSIFIPRIAVGFGMVKHLCSLRSVNTTFSWLATKLQNVPSCVENTSKFKGSFPESTRLLTRQYLLICIFVSGLFPQVN